MTTTADPGEPAAASTPVEGFTPEERAAMKERARELKASARRGRRAGQAQDESDVLAKIAEMSDSDRAMAERIHAIVAAGAPELSPRLWCGMPAYAKGGKVICFFQAAGSSRPGTRPSVSTTRRTSTTASCGRRRSR